jgi:hypothetical protein
MVWVQITHNPIDLLAGFNFARTWYAAVSKILLWSRLAAAETIRTGSQLLLAKLLDRAPEPDCALQVSESWEVIQRHPTAVFGTAVLEAWTFVLVVAALEFGSVIGGGLGSDVSCWVFSDRWSCREYTRNGGPREGLPGEREEEGQ